ncbi:MAG: pyroglutamyl-peptidase I [Candidatus Bathyarchaeota archaeon]|nr:MAG: pyroglutamyl-peptidase I [Candidatus Bathyarchaeota archaeon]
MVDSMDEKVILLTGFEPFGGNEVNPSIQACRELEGKTYNGYRALVEETPLRYHEIKGLIEGHIERYKPAAVICTGQGGGGGLSVERVAINVASARMRYNCGYKPIDEPLNSDGPVAYWTKLPFRELLVALKEAGIPSRLSNSAGTFGCNQIFYHLMDCLARERLDVPAGFIHVPMLPEQVLEKRNATSMSLDLIAKGLAVVVEEISKQLL